MDFIMLVHINISDTQSIAVSSSCFDAVDAVYEGPLGVIIVNAMDDVECPCLVDGTR